MEIECLQIQVTGSIKSFLFSLTHEDKSRIVVHDRMIRDG